MDGADVVVNASPEQPMNELTATPEYDIIIVGYGPVGATLAGLLGLRGIRTLVLEREDTVWPLPRAGTCDDEALRIWQTLGIADTLMEEFLPQDEIVFLDAKHRQFFQLERPT